MRTPGDGDKYAKHLGAASKLAQWLLGHPETCPTPGLPYHDHIIFDANGNFVEPPPGVALPDTLFFLIVTYGIAVRD